MVRERGSAPATVLSYEKAARRFLREQAAIEDVFAPQTLTGADINAFLLRDDRVSAGSAKGRMAALRFLHLGIHLRGIIASALGTAVLRSVAALGRRAAHRRSAGR